MKKVIVKPLDLEIESQSDALCLKYDRQRNRLIMAIDQNELSHTPLKDTGGDPHPQYLDMIRHRAMDHSFLDLNIPHKHPKRVQYFFERYDNTIDTGCLGYTIIPDGVFDVNIYVISRYEPLKLTFDILYNGKSIFDEEKITERGYKFFNTYAYTIPPHISQIGGPGILEFMVLEVDEASDLMARIELL